MKNIINYKANLKRNLKIFTCLLVSFVHYSFFTPVVSFDRFEVEEMLNENNLQFDGEMPDIYVFKKAFKGYKALIQKGLLRNDSILTIIDFTLPSSEKRLWILDLKNHKVLTYTYVAHGKNTGAHFANTFSNKSGSLCSSLGFYVTGDTYFGKNGLSLFLDGMEKGINDKARERYVVMHGANYVSEKFIEQNGMLGRSFGCPAVSQEETEYIIETIKQKSCLFIHHHKKEYYQKSSFLP